MRTFVAIELDEACRGALEEAVETLRGAAGGVRWVKPQSLHLTVKFIGELAPADLPRAVQALETAASVAGPFVMAVSGLSGFPARGTPRVIHVGLHEGTGTLQALYGAVDSELARELGIERESRRFVAHVTLGRVKDRRRCPPMEEISAAIADQDFGQVSVDSMVLMRSDLRPDGAVYTPLHRFPLGS